ncbi:hypothetical protein KC351_g3736 [Hortaea werneckii]|nr:hypothetical protein KC351_g3736 [Hortaea werneckii]
MAPLDTSRHIETLIVREIKQHGPLPSRWYFQYDIERDRLCYRLKDNESVYQCHPLSSDFRKKYPQTRFEITPRRATCVGVLHPPHCYQAGEWTWTEATDGFTGAVGGALNAINSHLDRPYVFDKHIRERVHSIKNETRIDEQPQDFYHPLDRPSLHRTNQAANKEVDAAMLARELGHSLAVIEVEDFTALQLLNPELETPKVQARWSLGSHYELFPPLYVGYCLGKWFCVKFRDQTRYGIWDGSGYDWNAKAQAFRQHGVNVSCQDLIRLAVGLHRIIRAGFPCRQPSLDGLVLAYYNHCQISMEHEGFLTRWLRHPEPSSTCILTMEWVTHAIAFGDAKLAKKVANDFDVTYALVAARMAGQPSDSAYAALLMMINNMVDLRIRDEPDPQAEAPATIPKEGFNFSFSPTPGSFFGKLSSDTAVRWRPSLVSQMPTFTISIRQNYFTGDQKKLNLEQRKNARKAGESVPNYRSDGRSADMYPEGHIEEEFEFDLGDLDHFSIQEVSRTSDHFQELVRQRCVLLSDDAVFGIMQWRSKKGLRPSRTRHQAESFSPGSEQAALRDKLMRRELYAFTVLLPLAKAHCGDTPRKYVRLANHDRYLTLDGKPRNDWFLSRSPMYLPHGENRFLRYQECRNEPLPVSPCHFMCALLHERDERNALQLRQYSFDIQYPARVQEAAEGDYSFDVQIKGDVVALGGSKILPNIGSQMSVHVVGLSDGSDEATVFQGRVFDVVATGYDFKVVTTIPGGIKKEIMHDLCSQGIVKVHVIWRGQDPDNARKVKALMKSCRLTTTQQATSRCLTMYEERPRAKFTLRNVLLDQETDTWAPNLLEYFVRSYDNDTLASAEAKAIATSMPDICMLDAKQKQFFHSAFAGPYANTILLEVVPGSGKTTCLSALVVALMRLGAKVLISSQSNSGASALFDRVIRLIESREDLEDLRHCCVRYRSNVVEELELEQLQSGLQPDELRRDRQKYSMAARIHDYIESHPADPLVQDYHTTAFMSTNLQDLNYEAHALFFDEASQATEPDLLMALVDQPELVLVVLAGDLKQLGPVVPSLTNRRNPYGNILATSSLKRMKESYPQIERLLLNRNYRAHPSLIAMPSKLFYEGSMVAGSANPAVWDTPLARNVLSMLAGRDFSDAFADRYAALSNGNRQFFVDVPTEPMREEDGTSWRNEGRVEAIVAIAKRLTSTCQVQPSDIGIISMYREDLRYLKERLKESGLLAVGVSDAQQELKASMVDAFQGQQRRVMIVHFAAAFARETPLQDPFGFIKDETRLNVATTRARECQFLVGYLSHWMKWERTFCTKTNTKKKYTKILDIMNYVVRNKQVIEWKKVRGA